jgi:hypothetical protein
MSNLQKFAAILISCLVFAGCAKIEDRSHDEKSEPESTGTVTSETVIRIAKEYVESEGFAYDESEEIKAVFLDGRWWVFFEYRPDVIGGDFTVEVSADGEVIRVIGGH